MTIIRFVLITFGDIFVFEVIRSQLEQFFATFTKIQRKGLDVAPHSRTQRPRGLRPNRRALSASITGVRDSLIFSARVILQILCIILHHIPQIWHRSFTSFQINLRIRNIYSPGREKWEDLFKILVKHILAHAARALRLAGCRVGSGYENGWSFTSLIFCASVVINLTRNSC